MGPLEAEMLNKVRNTSLVVALIAGASPNENAHAHRISVWHGAGDDPQSVIKDSFLIQDTPPFLGYFK